MNISSPTPTTRLETNSEKRDLELLRLKRTLCVLMLIAQASIIVHAKFSPKRYFAWAPHDFIDEYHLVSVNKNGQPLEPRQIRNRYRIREFGVENRATIELTKDIIRQYEAVYGKNDEVRVRLLYRRNGGPVREWLWPEGKGL